MESPSPSHPPGLIVHWPILLVFCIGFFLRLLYPLTGSISFSYDQARDAFAISQILKGDLKILGPPTSTQDFYHGVLFYYVAAVGYLMGQGSPVAAVAWLAFVNSLGIILIYFFGQQLFRHRFISLAAALLWAVSFEQTQLATYLTNTSLAAVTVPMLYFGLYLWLANSRWGPLLAGLGWGLSVQANFSLLYHLPVLVILFITRRLPVSRTRLAVFLAAFFISVSSIILAEVKFGFPSRSGPLHLLSGANYTALKITPARYLVTLWDRSLQLFGLNIFPPRPHLATLTGLVLLTIFIFSPRRPTWWPIIVLGILSLTVPLLLGGISSPYLDVGLASLVIILFSYFLDKIYVFARPLVFAIVGLILISQLSYFKSNFLAGQSLFSIQKTMLLATELEAVDFVYRQAKGQPFSLNTITAPLFINTTWAYLFNWYGQNRYGYLPYWHGRDQIDQPGDLFSRPPSSVSRYFLIIEPSQGLPQDIIDRLQDDEKNFASFNLRERFGDITVQDRSAVPNYAQ